MLGVHDTHKSAYRDHSLQNKVDLLETTDLESQRLHGIALWACGSLPLSQPGPEIWLNIRPRPGGIKSAPVLRFQFDPLEFHRAIGVTDHGSTHRFLRNPDKIRPRCTRTTLTLLASTRDIAESLSTIEK